MVFALKNRLTPKKTNMTLENPPCSIGNTSSFMVDFPASHVSFRGGMSTCHGQRKSSPKFRAEKIPKENL